MSTFTQDTYTAFLRHRQIASGPLTTVVLTVKQAQATDPDEQVLVFENRTGQTVELDLRGSDEDALARLPQADASVGRGPLQEEGRGRGRPKLGVVAREVTLLPRHWEWLAQQPGGASVALRKLVEDARRGNAPQELRRNAHERAYHFMSAIAGDLPGFEEATRALFADDQARFKTLLKAWPGDIRRHAIALAFGN